MFEEKEIFHDLVYWKYMIYKQKKISNDDAMFSAVEQTKKMFLQLLYAL